jgi:hypothetical protein
MSPYTPEPPRVPSGIARLLGEMVGISGPKKPLAPLGLFLQARTVSPLFLGT